MRIHHATAAKAKKFQITLTVEDNEIVATGKGGVRLASGLQGNKVLEDAITKQTGKAAKGTAKINALVVQYGSGKPAKGAKTTVLPSTGKEVSIEERTARGEGWTKKRGGGFRHIETDEESDVANWAELCEEQDLIEPHSEEEAEADMEDGDKETGTRSVVKAKYKTKYKPTKNRCGDELSHRMNEHCSREDDDGEMKINLDALRKFAKANECWVEGYASLKSRVGTFNGGMAMMNVNNRLRARLRKIAKEQERAFDIDKDISWK